MSTLKTNKEVKAYNQSLLKIDPQVTKGVINGPKVMVRLFMVYPQTKSNLLISRFDKVPTEGGKLKAQESENHYQLRGVVVNVSPDCTDKFREKCSVGKVVDLLPGTEIFKYARVFERHSAYNLSFDNYFSFGENQIDWIWNENPEDTLQVDFFEEDIKEAVTPGIKADLKVVN